MTAAEENRGRTLLAFAAVTSLFFAWGFITSNNDPLIVALRAAFSLDYTEALLTQIVFFVAYGLLSLPAAWVSSRLGPVDTILGALALMACGCLTVVASTPFGSFWLILAALFVLAAGFTTLQVAANPLAARLGPAPRSHFRQHLHRQAARHQSQQAHSQTPRSIMACVRTMSIGPFFATHSSTS